MNKKRHWWIDYNKIDQFDILIIVEELFKKLNKIQKENLIKNLQEKLSNA